MKNYIVPVAELISFEDMDILTASLNTVSWEDFNDPNAILDI